MTTIRFIDDGRGGERLQITDARIQNNFKELTPNDKGQRTFKIFIPTAEMADEIAAHGYTGVSSWLPENAPEGVEPIYTFRIKFKYTMMDNGTWRGPDTYFRDDAEAHEISPDEVSDLQNIYVDAAMIEVHPLRGTKPPMNKYVTAWADSIVFKRSSYIAQHEDHAKSWLLNEGVVIVS